MGLKLTLQGGTKPKKKEKNLNICATKLHQNLTLNKNCFQFKDFLTL
jgi:hypothetical protein